MEDTKKRPISSVEEQNVSQKLVDHILTSSDLLNLSPEQEALLPRPLQLQLQQQREILAAGPKKKKSYYVPGKTQGPLPPPIATSMSCDSVFNSPMSLLSSPTPSITSPTLGQTSLPVLVDHQGSPLAWHQTVQFKKKKAPRPTSRSKSTSMLAEASPNPAAGRSDSLPGRSDSLTSQSAEKIKRVASTNSVSQQASISSAGVSIASLSEGSSFDQERIFKEMMENNSKNQLAELERIVSNLDPIDKGFGRTITMGSTNTLGSQSNTSTLNSPILGIQSPLASPTLALKGMSLQSPDSYKIDATSVPAYVQFLEQTLSDRDATILSLRQNQDLRDKFFGAELETLKQSMVTLQQDTIALQMLTTKLQETNMELQQREQTAQLEKYEMEEKYQKLLDAIKGLKEGQALLDSLC